MARRSTHNSPAEGFGKSALKKKHLFGPDLLDAIDERPEFHDPYSELNLFLSQKVKNEMRHCSNSKKWSPQLQDELLCKIAPEFQERFPKYRLGVSAIKKTWEKVQYFSGQVQERKEALTQDGKLNIPFFIKENLKSTSKLQNTCHVHPCHYAHQLAAKMSECIAVVDGIRPKLEQLTRTIWSLQRHLIPSLSPEHFKSPYDENEQVDKLVVRALIEITAKHPEISQAELVFHLQKRLIQLRHVTTAYTETQMRKMLSALYADQCHYPNQRMERTLERIPYPTAKCLKGQLASLVLDNPHMGPEQITEEAFAYFQRASHALADLEEEEIERKIQNWAIQNDMLMRWIRLNPTSALYKEVVCAWKEKKDLTSAIKLAQQNFFDKYPKTIGFAKELENLSWIYLKHYWYTANFPEKVSTFDRFLKWHKERQKEQKLSPQELLEKMEKLSKKTLPLLPFNTARARTLLFTEHQ
ncbi:MAG: hypothetical protein P0S96_03180 [Simkaniaceae bacterium]|nr:hypothetical protein [Candidatus Sacchlamyda saccharinae]